MKKGIRAHDVAEKGLERICKRCFSEDIPYIQLVLEKSVDGFETGKFTQEYANSIKEQLGKIKVAILGSYINPSNPDDNGLQYDIAKFKEKISVSQIR